MARYKSTGTLVPPTRAGGNYAARIRVNGIREWFDLATPDKVIAERKMRKLAKLASEGKIVAEEAAPIAAAPESLIESLRAYAKGRVGHVKMASYELGYIEHQIARHEDIVRMPVTEIRPKHLLDLLSRIVDTPSEKTGEPISLQTLKHCRALLSRFFKHMTVREVVTTNPMPNVTLASLKSFRGDRKKLPTKDQRPHVALTDSEYNQVLAAPVDFAPVRTGKRAGQIPIAAIEAIENKVLLFGARGLGGARTHELLQTFDWTMIDTTSFRSCKLQRAKVEGKPAETHILPVNLQPFLRGWWEIQGRPVAGAVFPTQRGPRRGQRRRRQSLAHRMRRYFMKCGVTRHELHNDTEDTRRWDFHTLRREAKTGMDRAGMTQSDAMTAMGHSDPKVHEGYALRGPIQLPEAALPQINPRTVQNWSELLTNRFLGPAKCAESERDTGFEPATSSLGNKPINHFDQSLIRFALVDWVAATKLVSPCFLGIRVASLATGQSSADQKKDD